MSLFPSNFAYTGGTGSRSFQIHQTMKAHNPLCKVVFEPVLGEPFTLRAVAEDMGCGFRLLRISSRTSNLDGQSGGFQTTILPETWRINLNAEGIDTDSSIGGRLGDRPLISSMTYLLWSFFDMSQDALKKFKGFGFTQWPSATFFSLRISGNKAQLKLDQNSHFIFPIGSRILCSIGEGEGSDSRQGILESYNHFGDVATIDFDRVDTSEWRQGDGSGKIRQLTHFEPRVLLEGYCQRYGSADNKPFQFQYLGLAQLDQALQGIELVSRINDFFLYKDLPLVSVSSSSYTAFSVDLAQRIPLGSRYVAVRFEVLQMGSTPLNGYLRCTSGGDSAFFDIPINANQHVICKRLQVPFAVNTLSVKFSPGTGAAARVKVYIDGYKL